MNKRGKQLETSNVSIKELTNKYERVALVLQGGGALGSYQAGVYEGLAEQEIEPHWIAGISIGALNTAIIAGNLPENRVQALKDFWNTICKTNNSWLSLGLYNNWVQYLSDNARTVLSGFEASRAIIEGQNGFFKPRYLLPVPFLQVQTPDEISYYKTEYLKETLLKYADFDLINNGKTRVSVGAVNIKTGNFVYFDNKKIKLRPEHFMASGALPPSFPAVKIGEDYYWDGGIVSNTPVLEVLKENKHKDTLVYQVDLWNSEGAIPETFDNIKERIKDIQFSSRTGLVKETIDKHKEQALMIKELLKLIPEELQKNHPLIQKAKQMTKVGKLDIKHFIYKDKEYEGSSKDYEFSEITMSEHWEAGLSESRALFTQKVSDKIKDIRTEHKPETTNKPQLIN